MKSEGLKSLLNNALKHKSKSIQLYKDISDAAPNNELKELILRKVLAKEQKHESLLHEVVRSSGSLADIEHTGENDPNLNKEADSASTFKISSCKAAFISKHRRYTNFRECPSLFAGRNGQNGNIYRALMQFDLGVIPANRKIKKADLMISLFENHITMDCGAIKVFPVLRQWCEHCITWDTQPKIVPRYCHTAVTPGKLGFISIDVTNYVRNWYHGEPNYGILVTGVESQKGFVGFRSSNYSVAAQRPYLKIKI